MRRTIPLLAGLLLVAAALPAGAQSAALEDPIPRPVIERGPHLGLAQVADGLTAPVWATSAPGHADRLWVTDQTGTLWSLDPASGATSVVLDVGDRLVDLGAFGPGSFDERGFLGTAFHPDYADNGLLYTYTSEPATEGPDFSTMPAGADANHQTVVAEWEVADPSDPSSAVDPGSRRELLRIDQPQFNHNAGALVFGPDDLLYIALGDGGGSDDQGVGHSPEGNGQDLGNPLGAILRVDPLGDDAANGAYGIPADNPFAGDDGAVDEIFAYGFRNPFRMAFHGDTLIAGDVGQGDIEEVDVVTSGGNYGWPVKEGSFLFDQNGDDSGFVTGKARVPGLVDPVLEYDHDEGVSVIAGVVVGDGGPATLRGRYVFGDTRGPSGDGRLFWASLRGVISEVPLAGQDTLGARLLAIAEGGDGAVYVLTNADGVPFGETGAVWRLDAARGIGREDSP